MSVFMNDRLTSAAILFSSWLGFGAALLINHIRVRKLRGPESPERQRRALRAPASMAGLLLEGIAMLVAFAWRREAPPPAAMVWLSAALAPAAALFAIWAIRHLGLEWRVKAVVTEDHRLITTGPYATVRHPIYLALFGLILASALQFATWVGVAVATVLYLAGTVIRIRAEEGLLAQRFGNEFARYRARTRAFLPLVY
jgi:protein-S-isoprenylcysteine O-methyltransferase Ste14